MKMQHRLSSTSYITAFCCATAARKIVSEHLVQLLAQPALKPTACTVKLSFQACGVLLVQHMLLFLSHGLLSILPLHCVLSRTKPSPPTHILNENTTLHVDGLITFWNIFQSHLLWLSNVSENFRELGFIRVWYFWYHNWTETLEKTSIFIYISRSHCSIIISS